MMCVPNIDGIEIVEQTVVFIMREKSVKKLFLDTLYYDYMS